MALWVEFNECDEFKTSSNKYIYRFSTFTLIHCHFHNTRHFHHHAHFLQIFKKFPSHIKIVSTIYEIVLYLIYKIQVI